MSKFKRITAHKGLLKPTDLSYNGLIYNVMIEYKNRKITSEPLSMIVADNLVTYAIYVRENNLLDKAR